MGDYTDKTVVIKKGSTVRSMHPNEHTQIIFDEGVGIFRVKNDGEVSE